MRSRFALITLMILFGCALTPRRPWKLELTTSGGFTGRGNGAIAIGSDGALVVRAPGGGAECSFTATADELKRFESLIANARPEKWRDTYAPENKCCDRIEYVLTLTIAKKTYTTNWIDAPLPMPKDLSALAAALQQSKQEHPCSAKP